MKIRLRRHPQDADLIAIAGGNLRGEREAEIRRHVAACPRCQARLDAHQRIGRALAGGWVEVRGASSPQVRRVSPRLVVPGAAVALILVVALSLRGLTLGHPAEPPSSFVAPSSTIAPSSSVGPSATPAARTPSTKPGTFTNAGAMTEARSLATATRLADGRVLIAGGFGVSSSTTGPSQTRLASAELFDPAAVTFEPTGSMAIDREGATAVLLNDGRVLITGGNDGQPASAETYDPATGKFAPTGSRTTAVMAGFTATLLQDGRVLVAGGLSPNLPAVVASAELYDPNTGTFTAAGNMTAARTGHMAALLTDGRVLIVGGEGNNLDPLATAELYDPKTNKFVKTGSMATYRIDARATTLLDGRVLITGGYHRLPAGDVSTPGYLASAELYDPNTGSFAPTGSMSTARSDHTSSLLADGRVLVLGGSDDSAYGWLSSAEVYDPSVGTFRPTGSLTVLRHWYGIATLSDGRVFVAGGTGYNLEDLATTETYQP